MARIYTRHKGGTYYADYRDRDGRRVQRSMCTRDKAVAKERARAAELGDDSVARKRLRLTEAIDGMIASMHSRAEPTKDMYREKGRRLLKTLGNPLVNEIDAAMLDRYIERRRNKDDAEHGRAADHTISKELITVRRALKFAIRSKKLHAMPAWPEFSPSYVPRKTWLKPEQFECVLSELDEKRRIWASLAALAGANSSEVEGVAWETVDFATNRLFVPGTKREPRKRWVPMAPALRERLLAVPEKLRKGKVAERWSNVRRDLHAAVDAANAFARRTAEEYRNEPPPTIPRVSPNDLRRTFASWLVQNGAQLLTVAALMGHTSTRMLEKVYGRLSPENLEAAIALMPALPVPTIVPPPRPITGSQGHSRVNDDDREIE